MLSPADFDMLFGKVLARPVPSQNLLPAPANALARRTVQSRQLTGRTRR